MTMKIYEHNKWRGGSIKGDPQFTVIKTSKYDLGEQSNQL